MKLAAAVSIDEGAVLATFDRALPEVYDYLLHRCGEQALAEDLTSDTFLAAVAGVRRGQVAEISVAWLIGIARHKLADHWRRSAREQRHLAAVYDGTAVEDEPTSIEPGRGMKALAALNPIQRAALTLRYVDGLAVHEIAAIIGRSIHATETLLVRARAAFRARYDEEIGDGDD